MMFGKSQLQQWARNENRAPDNVNDLDSKPVTLAVLSSFLGGFVRRLVRLGQYALPQLWPPKCLAAAPVECLEYH